MILKKKDLSKLLEPLVLFTFWALLFASPILFGPADREIRWEMVLNVWMDFTPYLLVFLFNRFVLVPYLLFRELKTLYFTSVITIILIASLSAMMIHRADLSVSPPRDVQRPLAERPPVPPHMRQLPQRLHEPQRLHQPRKPRPLPPFINALIVTVMIIGFDSGLRIFVRWSKAERGLIARHDGEASFLVRLACATPQESNWWFRMEKAKEGTSGFFCVDYRPLIQIYRPTP